MPKESPSAISSTPLSPSVNTLPSLTPELINEAELIKIPHHLPFQRDKKVGDRKVAALVLNLTEEEQVEIQQEFAQACAPYGYNHRTIAKLGTPGKHGPRSVTTPNGTKLKRRNRYGEDLNTYVENATPVKSDFSEVNPNTMDSLKTPPSSAKKRTQVKVTKKLQNKVKKERKILSKGRRLSGQARAMSKSGGPAKGISAKEIAINAAGISAQNVKLELCHLGPLEHMPAKKAQQEKNLCVATAGVNSAMEYADSIVTALAKTSELVINDTSAELWPGTHIAKKIEKRIEDPSREYSDTFTFNAGKDRKPLRVDAVYVEVYTNHKIKAASKRKKSLVGKENNKPVKNANVTQQGVQTTSTSTTGVQKKTLSPIRTPAKAKRKKLGQEKLTTVRKCLFPEQVVDNIVLEVKSAAIGAEIAKAATDGYTAAQIPKSPMYTAFFHTHQDGSSHSEAEDVISAQSPTTVSSAKS